jgi:hypothetical protein
MAGGRRRHTIRSYQRRIDELLSEERERRKPTPPPISEEHADLRRRIVDACAGIEIDPGTYHLHGGPLCTPKGARAAIRALDLMFEERDLLTRSGVDWDIYLPD